MTTVCYGASAATVSPAAGVTGFLLKRTDGSFFFRIYGSSGDFTDYDIRHDDLEVTISPDALASFYQIGDRRLLDHSPEVLGLESGPNEQES
jgi:hypothetical protein